MHTDIGYKVDRRRSGFAESLFLALAARIEVGALDVTLPDGRELSFEGTQSGPRADLQIHRERVYRRVMLGGTLAFAEAYMAGDCDSQDPAALVECIIANESALLDTLDRHGWMNAIQRAIHILRPNSKRGARRNIAQHYDLGNDFYALWLDPTMTYSAAVFERPGESLEAAQDNKYRRMAERAGIGAEDHVLEVGCGWAGFCRWAAREIGCKLTAVTISRAQYDFAAQRLQAEGLADRVDLRLQDYRDIEGQFDRIVSIEMLEAVGESYWPRYFGMISDRLVPGGRAALQVITIEDRLFETYRNSVDFIQSYVFPGGMLPSPSRFREEVERAGLIWNGAEGYGADYARTLAIWRRSFEAAWPQIQPLGFDERFRRMWRYYLAYCEAGFKTGRIDVLQAAIAKS